MSCSVGMDTNYISSYTRQFLVACFFRVSFIQRPRHRFDPLLYIHAKKKARADVMGIVRVFSREV